MTKPLVVILMGSRADEAHCRKIQEAAVGFGLEVEMRVSSAHKTPARLLEILSSYESDPRPKVFVTVAGRSNALSGFADGALTAPVIACPPSSEAFGGADVYSSLRMPSGVAPAVVLEPANAALLAAKILALVDPQVCEKVKQYKQRQAEKLLKDDMEMQSP
jgi:5-(carboxyamino)imidazole ribonucleotide mutase/phosphoribosylaminoimidazole-succinocarboxamide synthase